MSPEPVLSDDLPVYEPQQLIYMPCSNDDCADQPASHAHVDHIVNLEE